MRLRIDVETRLVPSISYNNSHNDGRLKQVLVVQVNSEMMVDKNYNNMNKEDNNHHFNEFSFLSSSSIIQVSYSSLGIKIKGWELVPHETFWMIIRRSRLNQKDGKVLNDAQTTNNSQEHHYFSSSSGPCLPSYPSLSVWPVKRVLIDCTGQERWKGRQVWAA